MSDSTDYSAYLDCGEREEYRRMFRSLPTKIEEERRPIYSQDALSDDGYSPYEEEK